MTLPHKEVSGRTRQISLALLLLVIVMLGTALRFYRLGAKNLGGDEIITATIARQDVRSILQFHLEEAGNPPLWSLITHFFFNNWGHSEFIARLPSALLGSLSILLAYKLGQTLWTRRVGLMGSFLLAVNAYHVWFSQVTRYYALMGFLALLSLILLVKALQKNTIQLWLGFIICTTLSIYNHYFSLLFLPAEIAFGAWVIAENWLSRAERAPGDSAAGESVATPTPGRQSLIFCISLSAVALLYLPWVPRLVERSGPALASGAPPLSTESVELSLHFLREVLETYTAASGIALLVTLGLFLVGLMTSGRKRLLLVVLWIGTPFVFLAALGPRHFLLPKYVLFVLPVYLLVQARGISSIARWADSHVSRLVGAPGWPGAFIMTLTVLMLGSLQVAPMRSHYLGQKEDWRGAVQYLTENMGATDVVIADGQAYRGYNNTERPTEALTYYFSLVDKDVTILPAQRGLLDASTTLAETEPTVWGVLWHHSDLRELPRARQEVQIVEFSRVAVISVPTSRGDWHADAAAVLQAMLDLHPSAQGRFDLHLALAEICAQREELSEAASHLMLARAAMPDHEQAAADFAEAGGLMAPLLDLHLDQVAFDDLLRLTGYRLQPTMLRPGEPVTISLWWEVLRATDKDYTLFIHLVGPDGRIWAQSDGLLEHRGRLTSAWEVGQSVTDHFQLHTPPDAPVGEYVVQAGLYYWETGERLVAWDESGQRLSGDTVVLGQIRITD